MTEWKKCKKKPIVVEFREVQPNEKGIETLEGFKPCDPEKHYIMKGVRGEIYPIEKEIFDETYFIVKEKQCKVCATTEDLTPINTEGNFLCGGCWDAYFGVVL